MRPWGRLTRMVCPINAQLTDQCIRVILLDGLHNGLHGRSVTGDGRAGRAVLAAHNNAWHKMRNSGFRAEPNSGHGTWVRCDVELGNGLPAVVGNEHRLVSREEAGRERSSNLARGMAHHGVRMYPILGQKND